MFVWLLHFKGFFLYALLFLSKMLGVDHSLRVSTPTFIIEPEKALKSLDFKAFSFPKVGKSQYSLFAPVRLIFDGNFENQEVRYYEEN